MDDLKFNQLVPEVYKLVGYIASHGIEVEIEINWDNDPTTVTLKWEIPWTDVCIGCGELVPRGDHHYGNQGNGWHQYQRKINGEWVKFKLKVCKDCLIECRYDADVCSKCGKPVALEEAG